MMTDIPQSSLKINDIDAMSRAIAAAQGLDHVPSLSNTDPNAFPISRQIKKENALRKSQKPENMVIGTVMKDGTIFGGIVPDTGKAIYVASADENGKFNFYEAKEHAYKKSAEKGVKYHVPTLKELEVIFNNAAVIGGFQVDGSKMECWYWSTTEGYRAEFVMCKSFQQSGYDYNFERTNKIRLRLVHN